MSVPRQKPPNDTCARCGIPIYRPGWRLRDNRARYCSKECGRPTLEQRFWKRVSVDSPDECWEWQGSRRGKGYGSAWDGERIQPTHRIAWTLTFGTIPDGLWVLHKCDNPPCCNPSHLFLGTNADNMADMAQKGRSTKGRKAKSIHPNSIHHGEKNGSAKLTVEDVINIRSARRSGVEVRAIAHHFDIAYHTVWCIVNKKTWNQIDGDDSF